MWRGQARTLLLALTVSLIGYSCGDDSSSPPPPTGGDPLAHRWSKRFGNSSYQFGRSAAVDAWKRGHHGEFSGTVDFGGSGLTSAGTTIFVASSTRLETTSEQALRRAIFQKGLSVAVDASGNAIVTGCFRLVDFGAAPDGNNDIFVAKFDAAETTTEQAILIDLQEGLSVAADGLGNVTVTGFSMVRSTSKAVR
jgi:hypothetical protein